MRPGCQHADIGELDSKEKAIVLLQRIRLGTSFRETYFKIVASKALIETLLRFTDVGKEGLWYILQSQRNDKLIF